MNDDPLDHDPLDDHDPPDHDRASPTLDDDTPDTDHDGASPSVNDDTPEIDDDALADVSAELHRKTPARRAVEGLVSVLALVVMFALVLPKVTGSTYREVAHELDRLNIAEIGALGAVWAIGIVAYAGVLTAVLPGLRRVQGVVLNTATSAVSNVVPFGGAVGVGATYGINRSWGFGAPAITLAILVSGVWNVFLKLGLPVIALVLLVFAGEATSGLVIAAAVGFVALAASVIVLTLVMRSEQLASTVGRTAQRATSWGLRTARRPDRPGIEQAVLDFRHRSSGLISHRWPRITFWMLTYSLLQFALQLLCLRFLGEDTLSNVEVFAGFTFGRLLSTIPITPSGVGFADTGAVASLVAFGGDPAICTAGVLLFTGFVFLLEIPVGGVSWIVWARMKSWRRPPGSIPPPDFSTASPRLPAVEIQNMTLDHPDGAMRLYEARPDGEPGPGGAARGAIVVIQEAFGVNDHIEDVTRRFADAGYHAVAPDLFHRAGGGTAPYDDFSQVMPLFEGLDGDDALLRDVDAALSHLHANGWVDPQIGVVGFCLGGRISMLVSLRRPLGAGVGFYGGGIITGRFPQFPALVDELPTLTVPWLGLFGDLDGGIPVDDVERLRSELDQVEVDTEIVRYADADHGFHCDVRASYNEAAARDGWARTLAWFAAHLAQ